MKPDRLRMLMIAAKLTLTQPRIIVQDDCRDDGADLDLRDPRDGLMRIALRHDKREGAGFLTERFFLPARPTLPSAPVSLASQYAMRQPQVRGQRAISLRNK